MYKIVRMTTEHLDQVYNIEQECFAIPWSRDDIRNEIEDNKIAIYIVALNELNKVVGYAGLWHVVTEGHITNVAVHEPYRGQGIGDLLVERLSEIAIEKEMLGLTLEVRIGNSPAMKLYSKHGFKMEGIRKNYYSDTKEDAVIMWKYFV